jgi:hypothetical protein
VAFRDPQLILAVQLQPGAETAHRTMLTSSCCGSHRCSPSRSRWSGALLIELTACWPWRARNPWCAPPDAAARFSRWQRQPVGHIGSRRRVTPA